MKTEAIPLNAWPQREARWKEMFQVFFFFIRQCFVIKHWFGINTGKDGTVLTVSSWTNPSDLAP